MKEPAPAASVATATVSEPATAPLPTLVSKPASKNWTGTNKTLEILAASLLVMTVVIPWAVRPEPDSTPRPAYSHSHARNQPPEDQPEGPKSIMMSWDVMKEKDTPGEFTAFLIVSWAVGLAVIAVGYYVERLGFTITCCGGGLMGLCVLLSIFTAKGPLLWALAIGGGRHSVVLPILGVVFMMFLVVIIDLRLLLGARLPILIIQGVAGGAVLLLQLIDIPRSISTYCDMKVPPDMAWQIGISFAAGLAANLAILGAAVLSVVHAAGADRARELLSRLSLRLLLGTVGGLAAIMMIVAITAAPQGVKFTVFLVFVNSLFLVGSLAILFVKGLSRTIALAVRYAQNASGSPSAKMS